MSCTRHIFHLLRELQIRSRKWPYAGRITFALALMGMMLLVKEGHHLDNPVDIAGYDFQNGRLVAEQGGPPPSALLNDISIVLPYLDRWMILGGLVYVSILLRQWGVTRKLVVPSWVAATSVAAWAVATDIAHQLGVMQMTELGEPLSFSAYYGKLLLLATAPLCFSGLLHYYHRCGALDRYTMRTFLAPLLFCFVAFTSLWLIMDLLDNLKDFQEAEAPIGRVLLFYLGVLPFIFVSVMPASLLLSVLYTLTRMSRANEIIAMLGAGRSVLQILGPLLVVSAVISVISMSANYHWAPRSEGKKQAVIRGLEGHQKDSIMQSSVMYRDPGSGRTWFIASMPFSLRDGRLRGVQVREVDARSQLTRVIHADSVTWFPGGSWRFFDGKEVFYKDGQPVSIREFPRDSSGWQQIDIRHFTETPWSMISHDLKPDFMGVPEIISYLRARPADHPSRLAPFHAHLYHRFALPWQSFALALVAAPLGIAYSRRGAVGGIAGSIFIFFALLFLNNLCLNLGKGGHLPSWLSSWIPHLLFGFLGLVLLHYRSQNKDLPRLSQLFRQASTRIVRPRNRQAA